MGEKVLFILLVMLKYRLQLKWRKVPKKCRGWQGGCIGYLHSVPLVLINDDVTTFNTSVFGVIHA